MSIFDLAGLTEGQRAITQRAIDATSFPWEQLRPGLRRAVGRETIPVDWSDLSRWSTAEAAAHLARPRCPHCVAGQISNWDGHSFHSSPCPHCGGTGEQPADAPSEHSHEGGHFHVDEGGERGHGLIGVVEHRRVALGLAWYSGRISIEATLEGRPELAAEVFVAEAAHMVDFFFMSVEQKREVFLAYHPGMTAEEAVAHGHDWFDDEEGVGDPTVQNPDYWSWVGESFMSGFMAAYAPSLAVVLEPRQPWAHRTTPDIAERIRAILTPPPPFVGTPRSRIYHFAWCSRLKATPAEGPLTAEQVAKRRPCRTCRPG